MMNEFANRMPTVTVVIVTWNSANEITACLQPLCRLPASWEVWVSDNGSTDATVKLAQALAPSVRILENGANLGFAKACNRVIERTKSDYVLLLNPDTIPDADTLIASIDAVRSCENPGALGIRTVSPDGTLQASCFAFPTLTKNALDSLGLYRLLSGRQRARMLFDDFFDHNEIQRVDWLAGCFILLPRGVLEEVGGIPDDYFLFGEDIDLCYRIRQTGRDVIFYPSLSIVHKGNQSAGQLPGEWRIERTLFSKYAFCFKYFGTIKTRLIQLSDYAGYRFARWRLQLRGTNSPRIAEWEKYQDVVRRSFFMTRAQILEFLNNTPGQDNTR